MTDYRFGVDDYRLNYYPHDGVYDEQEGIDWSKVERVEIDWVDFVRERTCKWEYPQSVNGWIGYMVCSSCGEKYDETVTDLANYCPNCGCKVVSE